MYDSFDTLPILNWHNYLKHNDFRYLQKYFGQKLSKEKQSKAYERLIDSLGKRKLINGYYARCLQLRILFLLDKSPKNEQQYNNIFFEYLNLLNEISNRFEFDGKTFVNSKECYALYYQKLGHLEALKQRVFYFHFMNFDFPEYDFDLFEDLANIENFLGRSIDPAATSVNHYNAIKKQALKTYNSQKQAQNKR